MSGAHPYASIDDAIQVVQNEAKAVPSIGHPMVCPYCFGSKDPTYAQCFGCLQLHKSGVPFGLLKRVVPISMAPDPGTWYGRMQRYKGASPDDMYLLAAALFSAMLAFTKPIEHALGGAIDAMCVTPSTRGILVEDQRLWKSVSLVSSYLPPLKPLLRAVPGQKKPRNAINPSLFAAETSEVEGRRIVLIEDTWVTGSGAMSGAHSLMVGGAAAVLVLPIARRLEVGSIKQFNRQPYLDLVNDGAWQSDRLLWPRPLA